MAWSPPPAEWAPGRSRILWAMAFGSFSGTGYFLGYLVAADVYPGGLPLRSLTSLLVVIAVLVTAYAAMSWPYITFVPPPADGLWLTPTGLRFVVGGVVRPGPTEPEIPRDRIRVVGRRLIVRPRSVGWASRFTLTPLQAARLGNVMPGVST